MKRFDLEAKLGVKSVNAGFLKQHSLIPLVLSVALLSGCSETGDDQSPVQGSPIADSAAAGAAVKGPLKGAAANLYLIDYAASDLKDGEPFATGSTADNGSLQGLEVPGDLLASGPFLLEITGGLEQNDTAPIVPTLRTIINAAELSTASEVFATPMTTLIVGMAAQAASESSAGSSKESFEAALDTQTEAAITYFGLGLLTEGSPFTSSPLPDSEGNVTNTAVAYRTVGEVLGGLIDQLANADTSGVGADNVLSGLAADMADGDLDGQANGAAVDALLGIDITDLQTIMTQPVDDLLAIPVPGAPEGTTIANINTLMVSEAQAFTGVTPDVIPEAPELERMQPGRDSDGDGVPDAIDAFPDDSSQSADVDGDGVADRFDPCIAVGAGFTDTDNDGVCEDVGAVPLDIYLEDARGVAADNTSPDVSITDDSQTVTYFVGSPVNLAGVASDIDEKDGPLLTYEWSLNARPSGSAAELNDATVLTPFFYR
jgi:hypothetical protein